MFGALVLSLVVAALSAPVASAQSGEFTAVFSVDENAGAVQVELTIQSPRFDPFTLAIHDTARNVTAESGGAAVPVSVGEPGDLQRLVTLDLPSGADEVVLRYRIPSAEPRSDGYTRVNPAYVAFLAWVDPGLGSGSVRVELPPGFFGALDRSAITLEERTARGEVWVDARVGAASAFYDVVARNEAGLARSTVTVGGRDVVVAGWNDDPQWISFAENTVRWGVPLLADLIGQPWPEGDLVILESTIPAEFGYGGWYSVWESEIEVGDQLDETLLLHEIAHAWFHGERMDDRWIVEGWAEDFSALALSLQTGEEIAPPMPDTSAAGTTGLARWNVDDDFEAIFNRYETSWFVLHTIREEIGNDAMADVLAAIFEGRRAYHADGDPAIFPSTGTARLLDLLEEVGESELAGDLFRTYVFPAGSSSTLAERDEARAAYAELVAVGDFAAPAAVRDRLGKWRFAEAQLLIDQAMPHAQRMLELALRAEALGASFPDSLVRAYEVESMSSQQLTALLDQADAALRAAERSDDGDARQAQLSRFSSGVFTDPEPTADDSDDRLLTTPVMIGGMAVALTLFGVFAAFAFRAAREADYS